MGDGQGVKGHSPEKQSSPADRDGVAPVKRFPCTIRFVAWHDD